MATPGNLGSSVLASKTKTKKKHFVAQKVKLFRASDPLLSVLMWGVNHSVRARAAAAVPFLLLLLFLLAPLLLLLQLLPGGEPERGPSPPAARPPGLPSRRGASVPPSSGARPLHRAARAPLGPSLNIGPDAGRGIPSAFELSGRYQCRPASVPPTVCLRSLGTGKFVRARLALAVSLGGGCWGRSPGPHALLRGTAGAPGAPPAGRCTCPR